MKKIIELCQMQIKRRDITQQSDFLKLRLRGRGSGFKEGPEQRGIFIIFNTPNLS